MVDLIERVQAIEDVDSELDDDVDNEENVSLENEITGKSYELIEGELVPQARTDNEHGAVCARSIGLLRLYSVQTNQRARIVDSSAAFFMRGDRKNARKPDAAFTFHAHLPATVELVEDYMGVPPDLIIEVISPGNMANEMGKKRGNGSLLACGWCGSCTPNFSAFTFIQMPIKRSSCALRTKSMVAMCCPALNRQ